MDEKYQTGENTYANFCGVVAALLQHCNVNLASSTTMKTLNASFTMSQQSCLRSLQQLCPALAPQYTAPAVQQYPVIFQQPQQPMCLFFSVPWQQQMDVQPAAMQYLAWANRT